MKNLLHTSQSRYVGCLVPLSTVVPSAGSSSLLCPVVTWSLADGTIEPRKGHPTFLEYGWMAKVLQERASQRWEWQGVFNLLHTGLFFFFTRDSDPPTLCPEIRKKKKKHFNPFLPAGYIHVAGQRCALPPYRHMDAFHTGALHSVFSKKCVGYITASSMASMEKFILLFCHFQVTVLESTADPSKKICLANTHLYFHPNGKLYL